VIFVGPKLNLFGCDSLGKRNKLFNPATFCADVSALTWGGIPLLSTECNAEPTGTIESPPSFKARVPLIRPYFALTDSGSKESSSSATVSKHNKYFRSASTVRISAWVSISIGDQFVQEQRWNRPSCTELLFFLPSIN
jgi:hypothetical protein